MANRIDEFNDYGIKNPDGINIQYTDFQRVSSFNDMSHFVQETQSANVQETQSFQETIQSRGSDFRSASQLDLTNAPDVSNVQAQGASGSSSAAASSSTAASTSASTAAASTSAASATAASTAAASTAAAASVTTAAVSVGGALASAVATIAVVATLVVNAFTLGITFLSATFNSLSFNVSIENNEEMEEFRAVLYDASGEICQELTIKESQIVVFNDLEEGKEYTFVVYDKDEIEKFKNSYLTSTRKEYEDQITIEVTNKFNGNLSFDLFVPQVLANNVYTVRVRDESGKEWLAKDGYAENSSYSVSVPEFKDFVISITIDNKTVYQYKVAKALKYKEPVFDWTSLENDTVMATLVSEDGSVTKQIEAPVTYQVATDPTMKLNGVERMIANFTYEGKEYSGSTTRSIPALINNYTFTKYEWVDNGLDNPTAIIYLTSNIDGSVYTEEAVVTLKADRYVDRILFSAYNATYEAQQYKFEDDHTVELSGFYIEIGDTVVDSETGFATAEAWCSYDGLEEPIIVELEQQDMEITQESIYHYFEYRGVRVASIDDSIDLRYEIDGNYYILNDDLTDFAIASVRSLDNHTYEAPAMLYGLPVTTVCSRAFEVDSDMDDSQVCTTVVLNSNIDNYEEFAFADSRITSITFGNTLTDIVDGMFANCSMAIEDVLVDGVVSIGDRAFEGNSAEEIVIPDSVENIGVGAFGLMPNLAKITSSMTGGSRDAAYDTGAREEAYFAYIFATDDSWLNGGSSFEAKYTTYENGSVVSTTTYYVANQIEYVYTGEIIAEYAFSDNEMISRISFENATTIAEYAFYDMVGISNATEGDEIVIPNTVEEIGDYAFASSDGAIGYREIDYLIKFEEGTTPLTLGDYVFINNPILHSIALPNRTTSIGSSILNGCNQIQSISVPFAGLTQTATDYEATIGAYFDTTATDVNQESLYYMQTSSSQAFYMPTTLTNITITGTTIRSEAFAFNRDTTGSFAVSAPNVTTIGEKAFYQNAALTSFAGGTGITSIGNNAFESCTNITSFVANSDINSIGDNAFNNCSNLSTLTLAGARVIGEYAFANCSSLGSISSFNASIEELGQYAFHQALLETFEIGANLRIVGQYAFLGCVDSSSNFTTTTISSDAAGTTWDAYNDPSDTTPAASYAVEDFATSATNSSGLNNYFGSYLVKRQTT